MSLNFEAIRARCLIRFLRPASVSQAESTGHLIFLPKGRSMMARHSHVPNEEVAGPSLAFHLVRFCAPSSCFGPTATIWKGAGIARRGSTDSRTLGRRRMGSPPMPGASTDGCHPLLLTRAGLYW
jgi:hypothetical protein